MWINANRFISVRNRWGSLRFGSEVDANRRESLRSFAIGPNSKRIVANQLIPVRNRCESTRIVATWIRNRSRRCKSLRLRSEIDANRCNLNPKSTRIVVNRCEFSQSRCDLLRFGSEVDANPCESFNFGPKSMRVDANRGESLRFGSEIIRNRCHVSARVYLGKKGHD